MKPMKHISNTVWEKLDYLMSCIDGINIKHIRCCSFTYSHLIVNDSQAWAYIVHDQGTVVSEMSFEKVNYMQALKKFEKYLTEPKPENL